MKRIVILALILTLISVAGYGAIEAQPARAVTDTVTVTLNVNEEVAISVAPDVTMAPDLGVSSDTSIGSTTWNVRTNSTDGYTLELRASTGPAMTSGGNFINDYATTSPTTWNATTSNAYFGYSGFGTDTLTGTWGTDTDCIAAAGVPSATLNYLGLKPSAGITLSSRSSTTTPSGINTKACFAAEQKAYYIPSGTYTATVTATAVAQ